MVAVAVPAQTLSRHGIGASEIAAIAGFNPYASPWDIWLRKTGQAPDVEPTEPMEWGNRLEPAIRQKYVDDTGLFVDVPGESLFHTNIHWARATPDGIVVDDHGIRQHLLQCKNVGFWVGKDWEQGPPPYVVLQEMWEMHVTGLARADVAALIGGNEFRVFTVHRDDKAIADLLTIATAFWRKVETRTPPPVDESDACRQHFEKKLARSGVVELVADAEIEDLITDWHEVTLRQKHDEKRVETIRNQVRRIMAEAGATVIRSSLGDAKLSTVKDPIPKTETNWKHIAELLGATKCTPAEFAELVQAATTTTTPVAKAPTLYAPRAWSKEKPE